MNATIKPFDFEGHFVKGNLHTHTTNSDGSHAPKDMADKYKALGYDFIALTDHRFFAENADLCTKDFLLLAASEDDQRCSGVLMGREAHYVCVRGTRGTSNLPNRTRYAQTCAAEYADMQALVDRHLAAGDMVIYAHPYWSHNDVCDFDHLQGILGIEIYNHVCQYEWMLGYAENLWDSMLRAGKRVYGFATDDAHAPKHIGGGWICAKVPVLDEESVLFAIKNGLFYASNGPAIEDFGVEYGEVYVRCSDAAQIAFVWYPDMGYSVHAKDEPMRGARVKMPEKTRFVRCKVADGRGGFAYTQPIYVEG